VCRKGEFGVVPVQTWEQRMLAEAHAAAPASRAATAALPPIPGWKSFCNGAPPTKIMRTWRKAAEGGHAEAQKLLGDSYFLGIAGVAHDFEAAAAWYAKAAAQGHAHAQFNLGILYEGGAGVAQDFKTAAAWYAKAAAQGESDAPARRDACLARAAAVAAASRR